MADRRPVSRRRPFTASAHRAAPSRPAGSRIIDPGQRRHRRRGDGGDAQAQGLDQLHLDTRGQEHRHHRDVGSGVVGGRLRDAPIRSRFGPRALAANDGATRPPRRTRRRGAPRPRAGAPPQRTTARLRRWPGTRAGPRRRSAGAPLSRRPSPLRVHGRAHVVRSNQPAAVRVALEVRRRGHHEPVEGLGRDLRRARPRPLDGAQQAPHRAAAAGPELLVVAAPELVEVDDAQAGDLVGEVRGRHHVEVGQVWLLDALRFLAQHTPEGGVVQVGLLQRLLPRRLRPARAAPRRLRRTVRPGSGGRPGGRGPRGPGPTTWRPPP